MFESFFESLFASFFESCFESFFESLFESFFERQLEFQNQKCESTKKRSQKASRQVIHFVVLVKFLIQNLQMYDRPFAQ